MEHEDFVEEWKIKNTLHKDVYAIMNRLDIESHCGTIVSQYVNIIKSLNTQVNNI